MPLVAIDSNLIDVFVEVSQVPGAADALEAREPPPADLQGDWRGAWWVLMLGYAWTSVVFTFSDHLLDEIAAMPTEKRQWATSCLGFALELRDGQPHELRIPDPAWRPPADLIQSWGLRHADAVHLADAIGLRATHFLTRDQRILKRAAEPARRFDLTVQRLADFVRAAYYRGAPFPVGTTPDML